MNDNTELEFLPNIDTKEKKIIDTIKNSGGNISRQNLRDAIGGSNTTFVRKVMSLKEKGIIEEYKGTEGRTKTWYRFTQHAAHIFNFSDMLTIKKWFSASQKIELFPEFEQIANVLLGKGMNVYDMLGIKPQHMVLETSLASTEFSASDQKRVRDVLSLCNAVFQNIITEKIHPEFSNNVEGYIIFHYNLEKSPEEIQRALPEYLSKYIKAKNSLEQHESITKLGELTIKHHNLISVLTAAAMNIVNQINLKKDAKRLEKQFKIYKEMKTPDHMTRTQMLMICLEIFKKLHTHSKD